MIIRVKCWLEREASGVASRRRDETGASLVLALLFLVVIGLIVGGLASWTANDLSDAVVFQNARSAEFALNSATQLAIQNIRYAPLIVSNSVMGTNETLNASPPEYCWGGPTASDPSAPPDSELMTQGETVAVWCSTQWNPASTTTRKVTITACLTSPNSPPINTSNWQTVSNGCAANPGLQTVVSFDDYQSNLSSTSPCTSTCGTGMTIDSSSAGPTDPTVTGLSTAPATSPPSGPVTGGTALTIAGSGFVSGLTTVFLVDPLTPNLVITIAPSIVTFNSSTSISVTTPGVTTSANYDVAVSTPSGNSLDGPPFAYQPVIPTVSAMTPSSGSANGGTALTIDGTGFLSNLYSDLTKVIFTDTANTAITATVAQDVSVNSSGTVVTVTTPSITTEATYYVQVETSPGGTSAQSANFEFTFQPYYPVADSITPATGSSGTVAITGLGFLSGGTTVTLIPESGGSSFNLTSVSVTSSTTLTAQIPTGEPVASYYVSITTTWNGTPYQSCNSNGNGGIPSCASEGAPTYSY